MDHITPPVQDTRRAGTRTVVEAIMQATPVTAGIARLYQFTHPSQCETEVANWRVEISAQVNEHTAVLTVLADRLGGRLVISDLAFRLGMRLVETDHSGIVEATRNFDAVRHLLPDEPPDAVAEALHELEDQGLLFTHATLGKPIAWIRPCCELYEAFDLVTLGYDTINDARHLARLMVSDGTVGNIPKLFKEVGWPYRRFNPALTWLLSFFDEGRVGRTLQPNFPTRWLSIGNRERRRLKSFLSEGI